MFPLLATGVEHMSLPTLGLLFLSGVLLGGVFRHEASWLASVLVMAAMPVVALAELVKDGSSHNLLPLELVMYGALTVLTLLGAGVGVVARRKVLHVLGGPNESA